MLQGFLKIVWVLDHTYSKTVGMSLLRSRPIKMLQSDCYFINRTNLWSMVMQIYS